jgi:hypothetical protein
MYDYSSFTTSLGELPNFAHWLASYFTGINVILLDPKEGLQSRDVGDILRDYNEVELNHPVFTLSDLHPDSSIAYARQKNGGMLGVPGNIGMSTLVHGLFATAILGTEDGCVAGDDALLVCSQTQSVWYTIESARLLGKLALDKSLVVDANDYLGTYTPWKFLKRPFQISDKMLTIGLLPSFPSLDNWIHIEDSYHRSSVSKSQRLTNFITQTCSFMDEVHSSFGVISNLEVCNIVDVLRFMFTSIHLTQRGRLPGKPLFEGGPILVVPVISERSFREDWVDVVFEEAIEIHFQTPRMSHSVWPARYSHLSQTFEATPHGSLRLGVDLGFLEEERLWEVHRGDSLGRASLKLWLRGARSLSSYTFVNVPPPWWNEFYDYLHPDKVEYRRCNNVLYECIY